MNILRFTLIPALFNISLVMSMDFPLPKWIPQDVSERIIFHQISDVHNQVNTPQQARDYLVSASLVNKNCYAYANHPFIVRDNIHNLSAKLRHNGRFGIPGIHNYFCYHTETIAEKLNTPGSKNYTNQSMALFSEHLKTENVIALLNKGADPNYDRIIEKRKHIPQHYHADRFKYTTDLLSFYASGTSDTDLEIMQLLLENGALLNKAHDFTPLEIAVKNALPKMVALLLSYKPHISNRPDNILALAIHYNNAEIIELLQNYLQKDCNLGLREAVLKQNPQLIQELFNHGAQPEYELEGVISQTLGQVRPSLPTTEILQLFCDNGIKNEQLLKTMISETEDHIARSIKVLSILQLTHYKAFGTDEDWNPAILQETLEEIPNDISNSETGYVDNV